MTAGDAATPLRRALGRAPRIVCAAALLLLAAAPVGLALVARARAGAVVEDAGAILLRPTQGDHADAVQTLHVNGLRLRMRSGHTRLSVRALLDAFDQRCTPRGGVAWTQPAVQSHWTIASQLSGALRPVLRGEDEAGGHLACLDLHAEQLAPAEIARRVQMFADGGDLTALGDLRVVWARRDVGGTSYVVLWSEGSLRLARAFPGRGDAPGEDLPGVPRPPGGRRVLSVRADPRAPMLASYRVDLPPSELAVRYRRALIAAGFSVRAGAAPPDARPWLLAARADAFTVVAIARSGARQCTATLLPLH